MKQAHTKAIETALKHGQIISFDPNVRLMLWDDHDKLKQVIWDYVPYAHILKIADEELEFICDTNNPKEAAEKLLIGNVQLVLVTCGADGVYAFTKNTQAYTESLKVKAIDTTGAGDGFIGSFLYQCAFKDIHDFSALSSNELEIMLRKSSIFAGESVTKHGAISSYPTSLSEDNE